MTLHPLAALVAASLIGSLALVGCKKNEPAVTTPAVTSPQPAPLPPASSPASAVTVSTVDLGNAVDGNRRVTTPTTAFSRNDTIYASVATSAADGTGPASGRLAARWTYQDGQVVDELSQDFNFSGSGHTVFQISNPDPWPVGSYKLEILHDGNVVQTRQFEVR